MVRGVDRLNYQHLMYFWMVAREGTVAKASEVLRLAPSTLSGQIHHLEDVLGEHLFTRRGRRLVLTEAGRIAFRYADEIFSLGREFTETLRGQRSGRPVRLVVGVLDVLPKSMVRRLLEPAFTVDRDIQVICREDRSLEGFLADLARYEVDLVLSDAPAGAGLPLRLFNHLLGESGTTFFATRAQANRLRRRFPNALRGEPFLMPGRRSTMRRALEQWFETKRLHPRIILEADDSAFLNHVGEAGRGVFAGPTVVEPDIRRRYRVEVVGRVEDLRHRFYAITMERRITNPAVLAITERARRGLPG